MARGLSCAGTGCSRCERFRRRRARTHHTVAGGARRAASRRPPPQSAVPSLQLQITRGYSKTSVSDALEDQRRPPWEPQQRGAQAGAAERICTAVTSITVGPTQHLIVPLSARARVIVLLRRRRRCGGRARHRRQLKRLEKLVVVDAVDYGSLDALDDLHVVGHALILADALKLPAALPLALRVAVVTVTAVAAAKGWGGEASGGSEAIARPHWAMGVAPDHSTWARPCHPGCRSRSSTADRTRTR